MSASGVPPDRHRQTRPPVTLFRKQPKMESRESNHEHGTWKDWIEAHGPRLLLCARQWTRSLADAEDVLQEAFVRYWKHQRHLPGDPQALLVTSIRRAALDLARREDRRTARELHSDGGLEDRETFLTGSARMVEELSEKRRAAMLLETYAQARNHLGK